MRHKLALTLALVAVVMAAPAWAQDTPTEPVDVFTLPFLVRSPTEVEKVAIERLIVEAESARDEERFDDAEAAALQLIALAEATYGSRHPVTASSKNILGQIVFMRGDLDRAEAIFTEGLDIRRAALSVHPDVAQSLSNLASVRSWQGRYAEAPPLILEAIEIWRATSGPRSADVVDGLGNLGRAWMDLARWDAATAAFEEALDVQTEIGVPAEDRASTLRGLGNVAMMTGDYTTAERRLTEAMRLLEAADSRGLGLGLTLTSLGSLRDRQGRPSDAVFLHGRATDVFAAVLGADHAFVAAGLENTSGALIEMGDMARGVELQRRGLSIRATSQGESHPETATSRRSLAATLLMAGLHDEALLEAERALADLEAVDPKGLEAARAELVAARAFAAARPDRPDAALERASRARERLSAVLGPDHPETLEARSQVAVMLAALGRLDEAAEVYASVAQAALVRLGPGHPRALSLAAAASSQLERVGRPVDALSLLRLVLSTDRVDERRASDERRDVWRGAVRLMWAVAEE
jgi:tetratricopeptide (TPR) repeat protein